MKNSLEIQVQPFLRVYWAFNDRAGKEDKPENYATVAYKLSKEDDKTMLSVSEDNNENELTNKQRLKNLMYLLVNGRQKVNLMPMVSKEIIRVHQPCRG